jgi:hypothetical protein
VSTSRGVLTDKPAFQLGDYSCGNTPALEGKRLGAQKKLRLAV